jgi:hypothetical protein
VEFAKRKSVAAITRKFETLMVETVPFTAAGVCTGGASLVLCFIAYWYLHGTNSDLSYTQKRWLTLYDMAIAGLFFTQAVLALEVIGANDSVIGFESQNTQRGRILVHVHFFSQVSHLIDTTIIMYTGRHDRLRVGRIYYIAVIFSIFGLTLDNDSVLSLGTVRFIVLVNSLMCTAMYLYFAVATWVDKRAIWTWFCVFAQVIGYCALTIYCIAILVNVAVNDDRDPTTVFAVWLVHSLVMLWVSLSSLWKFRRKSPPTAQEDKAVTENP